MKKITMGIVYPLLTAAFLFFTATSLFSQAAAGAGQRGQGVAGTPLNIGAVLDLVNRTSSKKDDDGNRNEFEVRAVELNIGAPVDPYWDMFVTMSFHEDEFELEEAWVSAVLPYNFKFTAGRELIPFGYLNRVHEHDFPQIDQPFVIENLTTDHGLIGDGAHIEYLAPFINPTLSLSFGVYQDIGNSVGRRMDGTPLSANARSYFQSPDGRHAVMIGGSYLTTAGSRDRMKDRLDENDDTDDHRARGKINFLAGFDLKYRYTASGQTYRGLTIAGEYIYADYDPYENHNEVDTNTNIGKDHGMYAYAQWDFNRFWGAGYRFDYTDELFSYVIGSKKLMAHSVYGVWRATEFSWLRVQYQYVDHPGGDSEHIGYVQGVYFLGWHPPHRF